MSASPRGQIASVTSHVRFGIEFRSLDIEECGDEIGSGRKRDDGSGKKKYLGKYCVVGVPNHQSCFTPNIFDTKISMFERGLQIFSFSVIKNPTTP